MFFPVNLMFLRAFAPERSGGLRRTQEPKPILASFSKFHFYLVILDKQTTKQI